MQKSFVSMCQILVSGRGPVETICPWEHICCLMIGMHRTLANLRREVKQGRKIRSMSKIIIPGGLGRRVPTDFTHVEKYPLRFLAPTTPAVVNKVIPLPWWHRTHDQGNEGACVGFGTSMMMAIINTEQRRSAKHRFYTVRYDPWWLWDRAKEVDEWDDTNPGDDSGTSVNAACKVLRARGHVKYNLARSVFPRLGFLGSPKPEEGIAYYRWATQVDEMRACIAAGIPISIGVNWYENFDNPMEFSGQSWIGVDQTRTTPIPTANLGTIRGGHCVAIYGASDRRQSFRVKNSWGSDYPLVWLPYSVMGRLLSEYGEASIVTDR